MAEVRGCKSWESLAITGAIRDQILDSEEIAMILCSRLIKIAPKEFSERYRIDPGEADGLDSYDLFELVGRKRGFLISGGEINTERMAKVLVDEYRSGKLGRFTLEEPEVGE